MFALREGLNLKMRRFSRVSNSNVEVLFNCFIFVFVENVLKRNVLETLKRGF